MKIYGQDVGIDLDIVDVNRGQSQWSLLVPIYFSLL